MVVQTESRSALRASTTVLTVGVMAGTVPTPLYNDYRAAFGFSEITLTLIYAVYLAGSLLALVFLGRLSDQIGRRRAVLPALAAAMAGAVIFVFADGAGMLFVARALTGVAIAVVAGIVTAWITETHPEGDAVAGSVLAATANNGGQAAGAVLTGLLVQFAPLPRQLTYLVWLGLLVVAAVLACRTTETVSEPRRLLDASLRPHLGVPRETRAMFVAPVATAFAVFALTGYYGAIVPTLLTERLHARDHAVIGAVVCELFAVAAVATLVTRAMPSRRAMLYGVGLMVPGVVLLVLADQLRSWPLLLACTAIGGTAVGLGHRGSLQVSGQIAPTARRAEATSAYYVACYLGNAVPVIGVGVLTEFASPAVALVTFAVVVAAVAVAALITGAVRKAGPGTA